MATESTPMDTTTTEAAPAAESSSSNPPAGPSTRTIPTHVPEGYEYFSEGSANILYKDKECFYNPVQEFNRDMSIMTIKLYQDMREAEGIALKTIEILTIYNQFTSLYMYYQIFILMLGKSRKIKVLEALSATGI